MFKKNKTSKIIKNNLVKIFEKNKKINLLDLDRRKMRELFINLGECSYHADQVMKWIYHYHCDNSDKMTNLSKNLRSKLKEFTEIRVPEIAEKKVSSDGTVKWMVSVGSQFIETVYIPEDKRSTLCISSQIGCSVGCTFCSTAQQGFNRNLRVSEIIGQVWLAGRVLKSIGVTKKHPITNVVIMGMGEPLLNLKNVVPSIEIMLDDLGFGLSKRRVTLSTSGIVPALNKLGEMIDISLAISLHAPNDEIRNKIIPVNKKYGIRDVLSAASRYIEKTNANHSKVTIEYVMLDHINDSVENAYELVNLLNRRCHKINLIPWNPIPYALYSCSSSNRINRFYEILIRHGFTTIIRKIRGRDIDAACGQLTGNVVNRIRRNTSTFHKVFLRS